MCLEKGLAGLLKLRLRSEKTLVSVRSRLIIIKGWLLFPCDQFTTGKCACSLFRKATLKNSERFGTEELARIEGDMLEAREKSANLEYEIFMRIREEVSKYIQRLQALAQGIATVDVLQSGGCS